MSIGKGVVAIMTLAMAACTPAKKVDLDIPGARDIAYEAIRDGSGVLGYAEPLLGPKITKGYGTVLGPGATRVDPATVAGAWELPAGTGSEDVLQALRAKGSVGGIEAFRGGSLWMADYRIAGSTPVRLLLIDGNSRAFLTMAVPEVRPGPHVYLIAYYIR
ncbi:hypothetical protein [Glacieibacterium frigidum]|uniref:Lipoprotein n=1 Tax=Glacieibacterium frigidum TaxID=2593303 RepID=A0A552U812_9SPHN|nr:hypothetical protein [Glacieibacterium frigidum]TRW14354.1 hypothetical protein FMM06_11625 [Glacieibacterium frigidum]